jgi:hypothetical protein
MYNLVKKSKDDGLELHYKKYCKILTRVIREAKKLYYQKLISNSENRIQLTWKIINKETGKRQAPENITELHVGKKKVTTTREVVEVFNKYFINAAENLEMRNANKNEAMNLLDTLKFGNFPELRLIPMTEAEIKNILMLQKSKSSTGYDGISSKILK